MGGNMAMEFGGNSYVEVIFGAGRPHFYSISQEEP